MAALRGGVVHAFPPQSRSAPSPVWRATVLMLRHRL